MALIRLTRQSDVRSRGPTHDPGEPDGPVEGIPSWAKPSLLRWLMPFLHGRGSQAKQENDYLLQLQRSLRIDLDWRWYEKAVESFLRLLDEDDVLFLRVLDFSLENLLLGHYGAQAGHKAAYELDTILRQAGSVWSVASVSGQTAHYELRRRISSEAAHALTRARDEVGSHGEHLSRAWAAAFSRDPNPSEAYAESVKAVEAAAIPVVTPNDQKATLGRIIGELRRNPAAWRTVYAEGSSLSTATLTPVETIIAVLDLLWKNQVDRHGSPAPRKSITPSQAENAVHLALVLVRLFSTGALRRTQATRP